jgi:iron(III) transport system substrate-binding protein
MKGAMRRMVVLGIVILLSAPAMAAQFTPDPVDMAAAKREGKLSWYTSNQVPLAQRILALFEQQTGVKVQLFRSGGAAVLNRFLQEADAGRIAADVLTMSDASAANGLARRGLFQSFKPVGFDKVPQDWKDAEGRFVAQRMTLIGMMARTDKLAPADLPKTWSDLKSPKYKGKMIMPDPSFTSIQLLVVGTLSQTLGWPFYEALRQNDTMIVQGHQQVFDMLKRGERVLAAEGGDPRSFSEGEVVPNIAAIFPTDGLIFVPTPTAVIKGSPNPNAAKLFAQFMITPEVQRMFPAEANHSSRVDIEPPSGTPRLDTVKLLRVDYDYIEKNVQQVKARFNEIFQ